MAVARMTVRRLGLAAVIVAIGCGGSTSDIGNGAGDGDGGSTGDATGGGGGDGGGGDSGGMTGDSGGGTGDSGGGMTGDSGGGGTGTISCGNTTCNAATQDCCISMAGEVCGAKGSCMGSSLSCSSPSNCATGQYCCGKVERDGGFSIHATCTSSCSGQGEVRLCSTSADCPMGDTCTAVQGGLKICRASAPPPQDAGPG